MTKTLTEQWKNGELDVLFDVYVKIPDEGVRVRKIYYLNQYLGTKLSDEIEIFAPVPTYDQSVELTEKLEKLEKQLNIAVKALREYADEENWSTATTIINTDYFEYECSMYGLQNNGFEEAQKALKEIDDVEE